MNYDVVLNNKTEIVGTRSICKVDKNKGFSLNKLFRWKEPERNQPVQFKQLPYGPNGRRSILGNMNIFKFGVPPQITLSRWYLIGFRKKLR